MVSPETVTLKKNENHILKKINKEALKVFTLVFCKWRKVYLFIYFYPLTET